MSNADQRGFTLIELLTVVTIIGIIAAIGIPGLLRARIASNEAAAIGSVRAVLSAQADYNSVSRGYSDDLAKLSAMCPAISIPFLATDLNANGVLKAGYFITLAAASNPPALAGPNDLCGASTVTGYYVTAVPQSSTTGGRAFAASTFKTIWQNSSGAAPPTEVQMASPATATIRPLGR